MATLKLKPRPPAAKASGPHAPARGPVRGTGSGVRARPTLAEAQAERAEREARWQAERREREAPLSRPPRSTRPTRPAGATGATGPSGPPGPRRGERDRPAPRSDERRGGEPRRGAPSGPGPRGPERSSRRPTPTWDEPGRNQAFGHRPAPHPSFGDRPAPRPARPPLEPARRIDPALPRPSKRPPPRPGQGTGAGPVERLPQATRAEPSSAPGSLRLSKYMGQLGLASRREADEWIEKGWVRVDGRVVSELGSRVMPGQQVTIDARARQVQAQKVTVLVNKPVGYVSGQAEDGHEPALVLVKPGNQWAEDHSGIRWLPQHLRSLVPAGRLDIDSVGLLVLTQDGRIAKQLIGEHSDIDKEYLVRVAPADGAPPLGDEGLALLRHGLALDDEPLREAEVEWVNADQLRFVLREGKKRQIRRMCEAVGLQVLGLKRVRIGRVMLGDLPPGQWRYLRADEAFG